MGKKINLIGKCKLKPPVHIIAYSPEWLKQDNDNKFWQVYESSGALMNCW